MALPIAWPGMQRGIGREDTFLRIHGTNQPSTIGQAVSNGCARLVNDHVIEPYKKVPMGTKVYLYPRAGNPYSPDQHGMGHHS